MLTELKLISPLSAHRELDAEESKRKLVYNWNGQKCDNHRISGSRPGLPGHAAHAISTDVTLPVPSPLNLFSFNSLPGSNGPFPVFHGGKKSFEAYREAKGKTVSGSLNDPHVTEERC